MLDRKKKKKAENFLENGEKKPSATYIVSSCVKYFLPLAFKFKPAYFVYTFINMLCMALSPFVNIIFIPMIIAELMGEQRLEVLIALVVATMLTSSFFSLTQGITGCQMEKYDIAFQNYFKEQISLRSMEMDFSLTENKKALDQIQRAKEGMDWYSGGVHGLCVTFKRVISGFLTLLGVAVTLAVSAPWLLLVTVAILVVSTLINAKRNKIEIKSYLDMSNINRAFGYILFGLSDFRYGKDIRLYHAENMMLNKTESQIGSLIGIWRRMTGKSLPLDEGAVCLGALRDFFTYMYLGTLALTQQITISEFSMLCAAGGSLNSALNEIVFGSQEAIKKCTYAYEYIKFMQYPPAMVKGTRKMDNSVKHIIEFRDVSFRYPSTDEFVLRHVSVTLNVGEHLSVVGLNGAGKTTFIKLLCRLYDVTEGEILLDGVNIKEYDYDEYAKLFSVVFQDFRLFSFSFDENVTMDDYHKIESEKTDELFKLVGLEEKLKTLPNGKETMIFKQFDDKGIEPSGGEQQKLAIARALYKNAPVVILDEPTAALDPVAEYEIYRQFDTLVGGKTAVYISHRLSSCKFCDRIVVFSEGTVKEMGTHDELVNIDGGIYAEMFHAQAQYYVN